MKNVLYRYETSPKIQATGYKEGYTEKEYLLKYFPKYYRRLSVDVSNHPTISKIKRIKRIHHFLGTFKPNQSMNLWYFLLGNKRKDLYSLPLTPSYVTEWEFENEDSKTSLDKLKFFPNIRRIHVPESTLSLTENDHLNRACQNELDLEKACKIINHMRNLGRLVITVNNVQTEKIPLFVKSITKLKHKMSSKEIFLDFDLWKNEKLWSTFFLNHEFCQSITHLKLSGKFRPVKHDINLNMIPIHCKNLRSLSFSYLYSQDNPFTFPEDFFQHLETLQNIERFEMDWQKSLDFLNSFSLPLAIKSVALRFDDDSLIPIFSNEIEWQEVISSRYKTNPFEKMELYQRFYAKWESLINLKFLELNFESAKNFSILAKYFINPLLKIVPKLISFKYIAPDDLYSKVYTLKNEANFLHYLPFFSVKLEHFYSKFEELTIDIPQFDEKIQWDLTLFKTFSHLSSLKIKGWMSSKFKFPKITECFGKNVTERDPKQLSIDLIVINSVESFLTISKELKRLGKIKGLKLDLKMFVYVEGVQLKQILKKFAELLKLQNGNDRINLSLVFGEAQDEGPIESFFLDYPNTRDFEISFTGQGGTITKFFRQGKVIRDYYHRTVYYR